jgi:hypothetical protein
MFNRHRTSFYPLLIALATLGLGAFMLAGMTGTNHPSADEPAAPAMTESDYRADASRVIGPVLQAYDAAPTDIAKLVAVEDGLNGLMKLTVPAAYKDVHLGLAVSLTLMRDGLRGEEGSLDSGYAKLMELVGDYPWLAE